MKNINWFMVRQLLGYGIDLARIFPLITKQRGISKFVAGITSQIIGAPDTFWLFLLNLDLQLKSFCSGLLPRWVNELSLNIPSSFRLESAIQSVLG